MKHESMESYFEGGNSSVTCLSCYGKWYVSFRTIAIEIVFFLKICYNEKQVRKRRENLSHFRKNAKRTGSHWADILPGLGRLIVCIVLKS